MTGHLCVCSPENNSGDGSGCDSGGGDAVAAADDDDYDDDDDDDHLFVVHCKALCTTIACQWMQVFRQITSQIENSKQDWCEQFVACSLRLNCCTHSLSHSFLSFFFFFAV